MQNRSAIHSTIPIHIFEIRLYCSLSVCLFDMLFSEVKVEAAKAREQRKRLKQLEKQSESPEKIKKPAEKDEKRKRKESQVISFDIEW